jgi:hypothetical protein
MTYIDYEYQGWILRYHTDHGLCLHLHQKCGSKGERLAFHIGSVLQTGTWEWNCLTCHETMSKEVSLHLEQVYNLLKKT